ncbi:AMP-binding protein [candidate division KSB1 bacterium]|nr:AMP-binding protein [candidate division KSB1 bacterium]
MIFDLLQSAARDAGDQVAINFSNHQITYSELLKIIDKICNGLLKVDIKKGSQVALILPNTPHFIFAYYAILRIGAVVVPINPFARPEELKFMFDQIKPDAVFIWDGFLRRFRQFIKDTPAIYILGETSYKHSINLQSFIAESSDSEVDNAELAISDSAVFCFTSGVTAAPKCVELTHGNLMNAVTDCYDVIPATRSDNFAGLLPLSLLYAQNLVMHIALTRGASISLYPKIDRSILDKALSEDQITILVAGCSVFRTLIDAFKDKIKSSAIALKYCFSLGSPCDQKDMDEFEEIFNVPILEGYGLAEAAAVVSFNRIIGHRKSGTVGIPLSTLEVKIIDESDNKLNPGEIGQIAIRGHSVMKGYVNSISESSSNDGWFYTDDIGKLDEDGYLWFIERKDDVINKSGFTIFPTEIENKLKEHPKIEEICIVGVPHPTFKQEVKACIVLKNGVKANPEEFFEFCRERIPVYQCPQLFQFYDSLPKSSFGKIMRKKLREE